MNSGLKKRAYHTLILSDGKQIEGPVVVCFDNNDKILSWHVLLHEEPFTEWVGGVYESSKSKKKDS